MPYCANCGSLVEGAFCPSCGKPAGLAPGGGFEQQGAPPPPGGYPPQGGYPPPPAAQSGLSDNAASALCYLAGLITGVIFLVVAPYNSNRNVKFHAFQSIFFNVAIIAVWIAEMILSMILAAIPVLGWILSLLLTLGIALLFFCTWLYLMWKAFNGERVVLPVIGPLAEKQAQS